MIILYSHDKKWSDIFYLPRVLNISFINSLNYTLWEN